MRYFEVPVLIGSTEEKIEQLTEFLRRQSDDLNYNFENSTAEKVWERTAEALYSSTAEGVAGKDEEELRRDEYNALRSLVLKSAVSVLKVEDSFTHILEGSYLAESEYGTLLETGKIDIKGTPYTISQLYKYQSQVLSDVNDYKVNLEGYIVTGVLDKSSDTPVFGMEIGYNKNTFTVNEKEYTNNNPSKIRILPDRISFWQKDDEVAYIADKAIYFPDAKITGGSININNGTFYVNEDGYLEATSGKIGHWNIHEDGYIHLSQEASDGHTYLIVLGNPIIQGGFIPFLSCCAPNKTGPATINGIGDTIALYPNGDAVFSNIDRSSACVIFDGEIGFIRTQGEIGKIDTSTTSCLTLKGLEACTQIRFGHSDSYYYHLYSSAISYNSEYSYFHKFVENAYFQNSIYAGENIVFLNNNNAIYGKTTDDTFLSMVRPINSNNKMVIGNQKFTGDIVFFTEGSVCFRQNVLKFSGNDRTGIQWDGDGSATGTTGFHVGMEDKTMLLWGTVKLSSGTAVTSDLRLKNTISAMDERYLKLFVNLKPSTYKYNDGKSGRIHSGFIYQDVLTALEISGITTEEFAGVVSFETKKEGLDGYEGALRYEEFIAVNTYVLQKCLDKIKILTQEIETLKSFT